MCPVFTKFNRTKVNSLFGVAFTDISYITDWIIATLSTFSSLEYIDKNFTKCGFVNSLPVIVVGGNSFIANWVKAKTEIAIAIFESTFGLLPSVTAVQYHMRLHEL